MNAYNFYKEKYDLKILDLDITNDKIMFLIYDQKYYYYLEDDKFITEKNNIQILDKINSLNAEYKLDIINFYPVCYCKNSLVIALRINNSNTILKKYTRENMKNEYQKLVDYHRNNYFTLFVSTNVTKEISMAKRYINRYKIHEKIFKKYILTEKRRCKKEFCEMLYDLLPSKKSIIDISCGDNSDIFKVAKKRKYTTIVGNDICLNYLNLNKNNDVIYTNDNIELNQIKNNSYDVSFCKNTLHHMNNLTNINKCLNLLNKISNHIIIVEIMNPKEYKGLPKFLNKYLYTKFLKDVGSCYLNEEQFVDIINKKFKNHDIEYRTFKNILGIFKVAKISKRECE